MVAPDANGTGRPAVGAVVVGRDRCLPAGGTPFERVPRGSAALRDVRTTLEVLRVGRVCRQRRARRGGTADAARGGATMGGDRIGQDESNNEIA
jgi:hypothetical protein